MGVGRRIAQRLALLPPPSLTSFPPTAELPGCCHGNRLGCGLIVPGPSGEKKSMLVMKNPTRSSIKSDKLAVPSECRTVDFSHNKLVRGWLYGWFICGLFCGWPTWSVG